MNKIRLEIAGEIVLSSSPGETMKKWREIFGITQSELAKSIGITVSTISDYETNRRKSPGSHIIKRFVDALFEIDLSRGGIITRKLEEKDKLMHDFFEAFEFIRSITLEDFVRQINGKVWSNEELLREKKIYGYTIIDSIKTILEMPFSYMPALYGNVSERVFIFTGVSTGRSPLVVVRVSPTKPSAVVLHGITKVDPLAIKISIRERIPIITTNMPISEIREKFKNL